MESVSLDWSRAAFHCIRHGQLLVVSPRLGQV